MVCCGGNGRVEHRGIFDFGLLHSWNAICVGLDLQAWRYIIAFGSQLHRGKISNFSGLELMVRGEGLLLVGQEQDLHGGGFNIEQSLEGYMAGLLVFPQVLRDQRMKDFLMCSLRRAETAVVTFMSFTEHWEVFGDTEVLSFTEREVCGMPEPVHAMFPEHRSLEESRDQCHMLKGRLSAPRNERENAAVVKETQGRMEGCTISWGVYLWLGVRAVPSNTTWTYRNIETNEIMNYTNFRPGYSKAVDSYDCTFMDSFVPGKWAVYPCSLKTCTVCSFDKLSNLRLRGLCEDTMLDRMYVIKGVRNGKALFSGIGNTEIFWDNTTWVIADLLHPEVSGRMEMTGLMQYPLGLRRWNITGAATAAAISASWGR